MVNMLDYRDYKRIERALQEKFGQTKGTNWSLLMAANVSYTRM